MTANFQETLKALGKQAKKEAAEREAEAKLKAGRGCGFQQGGW